MTPLQAGALILVVKMVLVTGDAHVALAVSGPGASVSYDSASRLLIARQPTRETLEKLCFQPNPPKQINLPHGYLHWSTTDWPLPSRGTYSIVNQFPAEGGNGAFYLEEVGQGIYRKMRVQETPGFDVSLKSTSLPNGPAGPASPQIVLTYQEFTGGKYDPDLGAYVGRPTVERKEVSVAPSLKVGESALLVWQPSAAGNMGVDLAGGMSISTAGRMPEAEKPRVGDAGLPSGAPMDMPVEGESRPSGPFSPPLHNPRLVVFLEVATREALEKLAAGGAATAQEPATTDMPGLGSRILPPVAVKPSVEVAPLDREVLEARVRELEAQVDAAKIRLRQAERRFALGEGQYKAELMTQGDYSDLKDAVPLAQAELARVTAELDVERILLRRAIEASPQTSVTVVAVGEVKQPGVYLLPLNSTLLDLLVKAGGPTENADQAHATLMRTAAEGPAVQEVDLSGWKAGTPGLTGFGGMTSLHSQLRPGDVLVVPAKGTTGG